MSGSRAAAARIVSRPCRGISVPRQARPAESVLRADERDRHVLAGQAEGIPEVRGVRLRVGDHQIGCPKRVAIERPQGDGGRRAAGDGSPVVDERVRERDERVEDDRPALGHPVGRGHVCVPGVADHDHIGVVVPYPRERRLGAREPRQRARPGRPVVASPHLPVTLDHGDAGASQARDDLGVSRGRAVVRPEVERLHPCVSGGSLRRAATAGSPAPGDAPGAGSSRARRGAPGRGTGYRSRRAGRRAAGAAASRSPPRAPSRS
jgi:hypothetical protein